FAMFAMVIVIGPAIGPALGGWLTLNWDWRWCFFINVPIGILSFMLAALFVQDPHVLHRQRRAWLAEKVRVDYLGFILVALGLGALTLFLEEGQDEDWFTS